MNISLFLSDFSFLFFFFVVYLLLKMILILVINFGIALAVWNNCTNGFDSFTPKIFFFSNALGSGVTKNRRGYVNGWNNSIREGYSFMG